MFKGEKMVSKKVYNLAEKLLPQKWTGFIKKIIKGHNISEIYLKQHIKKQKTIMLYQKKYRSEAFVETGTYLGDMVWAVKNIFKEIYSIELSEELFKNAVNRFKDYSNITILHGDSGKVLIDLIPKIKKEAIFWLDGHYSGGITAKGEKECPIYEELTAIFRSDLKHILLIDDARLFNGTNDYPPITELSEFVSKHKPESKIKIENDIIRITPN